jgi:pentatricopeptide repeat protein
MRSKLLRRLRLVASKDVHHILGNENVALLPVLVQAMSYRGNPTRKRDRRRVNKVGLSRHFCSVAASTSPYLDGLFLKLAENKLDEAAGIFVAEWKDQHKIQENNDAANSDISKILEHLHGSPHQAEEFIKALHDREIHPKLDHYTLALAGWMHHDPPSAKRAQKLLDHMQQEIGIGYDIHSCNLVLQTWVRLNNAEGADKLFRSMLSQKVPVNQDSFSHILEAWSKSKSALAFKKADALLSSMKGHGLQPNIDCYLWTLSSWSKTKRKGSDERLEELYREVVSAISLSQDKHKHEPEPEPEPEKIQMVLLRMLQAFGSRNNAHRSEEILLAFADDYGNGIGNGNGKTNMVPPTLEMCLSVLTTWSRSKSSRRGSRAEKFLSLMEKDDTLPNPDVTCFTAVLNCLAGSNKPNSAQRAELVLRLMEDNPTTQPNLMTYTCVLNAWSRSKDDDAPHQADRIFQEMTLRGIEPDRRVFAVLISAWGRSSHKEAVEHAEDYFQQVKALYHSSADPANMPTVVEYTAMMQAWANCVARNVHRSREAVARVESLLEEMIDSDEEHLRPNSLTYAAILKTISGALRIPDRREHAANILSIMESQRVEVTPYIKNMFWKCSARE